MTSGSPQLVPGAAALGLQKPDLEKPDLENHAGSLPKGRSPLAHLLHALHQPLTGLQCSMELALAGLRPAEQYVRTLGEGLDLTLRMRLLVEAIGELVELEQGHDQDCRAEGESFLLDALLRQTAEDMRPVAESRNVRLRLTCEAGSKGVAEGLAVRSDRRFLATQTFRLLESALSLAAEGSELRITATREQAQVVVVMVWREGPPLECSPFSRPELGLLVAQAGWKRAGAQCDLDRIGDRQTCTIRMPWAGSPTQPNHADGQM
jgi:hypothetical protein